MLNKRGALAVGQIFILLVSIISFSILSSEIVKAQETKPIGPGKEGDLSSKKEWVFSAGNWMKNEGTKGLNANNPPTTPNPSHGFSGSAYEWVFGKGETAPKGTEIPVGEDVEKAFTASGAGFSVSGILQGAGWALTVYGVVSMIGGMFGGDNDAAVNAVASGAAGGIFIGKSVYSLVGKGGVWYDKASWLGKHAQGVSIGAGILVAAIIFYMSYKKQKKKDGF